VHSYSLTNSVYPNELISRQVLLENLTDKFWASDYSIDQFDDYSKLMCEGDLLLEFAIKDFLKDNLANVFQAGIGFGLEAGIGVGTLGAGAPAGVAAEMLNDMCFFGYSAADAIASIKNLYSELGEMKDAVKEMMSSTVKDAPQKIYDAVKKVINKLGAFFEKMGIEIKKGLEKLKELYRKLMVKMAKVAGDVVALISPVPGTDALVQNAIVEFADDVYKAMVKIFDKLPEFVKEYINNPAKMGEDVGKIIDSTIKFLRKVVGKDKEEGKSFLSKVGGAVKDVATAALLGPAGIIAVLLKKTGAMDKIIDWIEGSAQGLVDKALEAYEKIYPVIISAASAITIMVSDDHDLFKEGKDEKASGGKKEESKPKKKVASNESVIREEIGRNYHTINNMPYSMEDNKDIDIDVYANSDGTWTAKVASKINPSWSTPLRVHKDEYSAQAWVQKNVDIITRKQLNETNERVQKTMHKFNSIH